MLFRSVLSSSLLWRRLLSPVFAGVLTFWQDSIYKDVSFMAEITAVVGGKLGAKKYTSIRILDKYKGGQPGDTAIQNRLRHVKNHAGYQTLVLFSMLVVVLLPSYQLLYLSASDDANLEILYGFVFAVLLVDMLIKVDLDMGHVINPITRILIL